MSQPLAPQTPTRSAEKRCIACREMIDAKATKCPYCRVWQSRWYGPIGQRRLVMIILPILLLVSFGFVVFAVRAVRTATAGGEDFEAHRGEVALLDTKMNLTITTVAVIGDIRNDSPVEWEDLQFELKFMDEQGGVTDIATETLHGVRVPPGQTVSFKISPRRRFRDKTKYHKFDVRIVRASDAGRW